MLATMFAGHWTLERMVSRHALAAATLLALAGCGDPCGNEVSQTVTSPSGKLSAVVFNRNCGATTGFNTQVPIVPAGSELPADGGNTFIAGGTLPLSLRWQGDAALQIGGVGNASALKKETHVSGVAVQYAL